MQAGRMSIRIGVLLLLSAALAAAQSTPSQPDPIELLQNVQLTYSQMSTLSVKKTTEMEIVGTGMQTKMETSSKIWMDSTGRSRTDSKGFMGMGDMVTVNDGSNYWVYIAQFNQYSKLPISRLSVSEYTGESYRQADEGTVVGVFDSFSAFKTIAANVKDAKILRGDMVQMKGAEVPCWVVSVEYEPDDQNAQLPQGSLPQSPHGTELAAPSKTTGRNATIWVGKSDYLVYREDSTDTMAMPGTGGGSMVVKQSVRYDSIVVDQPIPEAEFTFAPPPGAKEFHSLNPTPAKPDATKH